MYSLWTRTERAVSPDPGNVPVWAEVARALIVGPTRAVAATGVGAVGQGSAHEESGEEQGQLRHHDHHLLFLRQPRIIERERERERERGVVLVMTPGRKKLGGLACVGVSVGVHGMTGVLIAAVCAVPCKRGEKER